jgi:hypothetical protein
MEGLFKGGRRKHGRRKREVSKERKENRKARKRQGGSGK